MIVLKKFNNKIQRNLSHRNLNNHLNKMKFFLIGIIKFVHLGKVIRQ